MICDALVYVLERIQHCRTYARVVQVCRLWRDIGMQIWFDFAQREGLLLFLDVWKKLGRKWTWVSHINSQEIQGIGYERGYKKTDFFAVGEWKNGKFCGFGLVDTKEKKEMCFGVWEDGKMNGYGYAKMDNGDLYKGMFTNGVKDGFGIYYWNDTRWQGDTYEGEWKDGKLHGWGIYRYASGAYYKGNFRDDCFCGYGERLYKCGDLRRGEWKDDNPHGFGETYFFETKGYYKGTSGNEKTYDQGQFIWANGDVYKGTWVYTRRYGSGLLFTMNGNVYEQWWTEYRPKSYSYREPNRFPKDRREGISILKKS